MSQIEPLKNFDGGLLDGSILCAIPISHVLLTFPSDVRFAVPDSRVWDALERNKRVNNCQFHIIKGFISSKKLGLTNLYSGYGTTSIEVNESSIPSYPLQDIKAKYNLNFNTLVADCEGFLETFFDENPSMYDDLHLVIFEADYADKCNYDKIRNKLKEKGFQTILHGFQNVWMK
jgi:hypothetical protein